MSSHWVYSKSAPIFRPRHLFGRAKPAHGMQDPPPEEMEDRLKENRCLCIAMTTTLILFGTLIGMVYAVVELL